MFRLSVCALSVAVFVIPIMSVSAQDEDADALAQRFFAHMKSNAPIAGEFEIRGELSEDVYQRSVEHAKKIKGARKVTTTPQHHWLVCRWGWDGVRELMETKSCSEGMNSPIFFHSPEGFLEESNPKVYTLRPPMRVADYRPGSFYCHFVSGGRTLRDFLEEKEFTTEPRSADDPPDTIWLIARNDEYECRVLIEKATGILHRMDTRYKGDKFVELRIDSFIKSNDHRVFPKTAELRLYSSRDQENPVRTEKLVTKRVTFPTSQQAIQNAMTLTLPKGSVIGDQTLNQAIRLSKPTQAREVLEGGIENIESLSPTPLTPNPDTQITFEEPEGIHWIWWLVGGLGIAVGIALLLTKVLRKRHQPLDSSP